MADIKPMNIQTRTPLQSTIIDRLSALNRKGSQELYDRTMGDPYKGWAPLRQEALQNFDQSIPTLAQRFTNMKANPQAGESFMNLMQGARPGLESGLGAMGEDYAMQQRNNQMSLLQLLLGQGMQPQFEPVYKQRGPNNWMQAAGAGFSALPAFFGKGA